MNQQRRLGRKWTAAAAVALVVGLVTGQGGSVLDSRGLRDDGPDREDQVDGFRLDVYVQVEDNLVNPEGFCEVEPCAPSETLPTAPLYNINFNLLNVTWGDFQAASARSWVDCTKDGNTRIRVHLSNLRPSRVFVVLSHVRPGLDQSVLHHRGTVNRRSRTMPRSRLHARAGFPHPD